MRFFEQTLIEHRQIRLNENEAKPGFLRDPLGAISFYLRSFFKRQELLLNFTPFSPSGNIPFISSNIKKSEMGYSIIAFFHSVVISIHSLNGIYSARHACAHTMGGLCIRFANGIRNDLYISAICYSVKKGRYKIVVQMK